LTKKVVEHFLISQLAAAGIEGAGRGEENDNCEEKLRFPQKKYEKKSPSGYPNLLTACNGL
jgi:hypothetical protein